MFLALRKYRPLTITVATASVGLALYEADRRVYASTFQRNLRTLVNGAVLVADVKLNFQPGKADKIERLHKRCAERILNVCKTNAGLYIKFGQQIASINHVLPPQYFETFRVLYDDAPSVSYEVVESIFAKEFEGSAPRDLFASFDEKPVASASIAQVHRATLKDGRSVAVKVQKPEIEKQIGWDLFTYRVLLTGLEKVFSMPLVWTVDFIEKHLREETDFLNEARNAERASEFINEEADLRNAVHVPYIIHELTSRRIMTTEWIDGIKFQDVDALKRSGFSMKKIMEIVVDVFAAQIFKAGFVHADPHPGNIIVRHHPNSPSQPQIVLLDHGLYLKCSEKFRVDYCRFWKSLFTGDLKTLEHIAEGWGIGDVQMFATGTLQKPWAPGRSIVDTKAHLEDIYAMQVEAKSRVVKFLTDTDRMPRELLLIGRNLNLVRANNKALGSPVNRVNRMALWAVKGLGNDIWGRSDRVKPSPLRGGVAGLYLGGYFGRIVSVISAQLDYWTFRTVLLVTAITFQVTEWVRWINYWVFGKTTAGFEDLMDIQMKGKLEEYGIVVDERAFDA